jgi:hypothetical protein
MNIKFSKDRDAKFVSRHTLDVISDLGAKSGVSSCEITSVQRSPEEQAHAMFVNCKHLGPPNQFKLYGGFGDQVITVYVELSGKLPDAEICARMADKIREIGPEKVSHHCCDPRKLNVVDIAASSIPPMFLLSFEAAVKSDKRIARHFSPYTVPSDPAFHLEIPQ